MTTAMKAAFTLTLEDKLSTGLDHIKQSFDALRQKGNNLTLGGLQRGGDVLQTVAREVRNLTQDINGVAASANRAWSAMKRMGSSQALFGRRGFRDPGHEISEHGGIGVLQGAAAGYSILAPLESAAEISNTLRHSAITAHHYGPDADSMMASQRALYARTAIDTAQDSHKVAEAGFWMALTGMSTALVNTLTPLSAKIATAYNTEVGDAAKTAFGLNYSMGIGEDDMQRALGMLALLGKHGHFLFADQAKEMPGIAAAAQQSHMTGMGSLEEIGAAMQISMKVVDPSQPNMAATNLRQFLTQIQRAREERSFNKFGVDLDAVLMNAAGKGISPMEAALSKIQEIQNRQAARLHITDPNKRAQSDTAILNQLFGSQEATTFASAMLHNLKEYFHLKEIARNVTTDMIDKDFHEAMRDLNSQMKLFNSMTQLLEDRLGFGFEPVLHGVNRGLLGLIHGLDWLDKKVPGLSSGVLALGGTVLVVLAAMGAVGFIAPAVAVGFGLILTSVELLATALAATAGLVMPLAGLALAGYEIYDNWDSISPVIDEVGTSVGTFVHDASKWLRGEMADALDGLGNGWDAVTDAVSGAWNAMVDRAMSYPLVQQAVADLSAGWDSLKIAAVETFNVMDSWTGGALSAALRSLKSDIDDLLSSWRDLQKELGSSNEFDWLLHPGQGRAAGSPSDVLGRLLELLGQSLGLTKSPELALPVPPTPPPGGADNPAAYPVPPIPPTRSEVEITVTASPGTDATVTRATPGVSVKGGYSPNPGQATGLP